MFDPNTYEPAIGDVLVVRPDYGVRRYNVTVIKLFPEYRDPPEKKGSTRRWWIEGVTKSGKTIWRFDTHDVVELVNKALPK